MANGSPVQGHLVAFDAMTLKELWRDPQLERFAKFNPPTIADGKVFRPVFAKYDSKNQGDAPIPDPRAPGKVVVYGLPGDRIRADR